MAVPITVGGQIVVLPSQSDKFAWGTAVTSALVLLAANTLQTTGGLQSLTAELDLGSAFGLKALYFKTRTTNPASLGILRLGSADVAAWRNQANSNDNYLAQGQAVSGATDELYWFRAGAATYQITGQCFAEYNTTAAQSISNNAAAAIINYGTVVTDTDSAVTVGASWKFTVPANKGGRFLVSACATLNTGQTGTTPWILGLYVYKNGSLVQTLLDQRPGIANLANSCVAGSAIVNCSAADFLDVRIIQGSTGGGAINLQNIAAGNRITIQRLV